MPFVLNTIEYANFRSEANAMTYSGPLNSFALSDLTKLSRVIPTATKNDRGVAKSSLKTTRTAVLSEDTLAARPIIIETSCSVPVGAPEATIDDAISRHRAWIASPQFVALVKAGAIDIM